MPSRIMCCSIIPVLETDSFNFFAKIVIFPIYMIVFSYFFFLGTVYFCIFADVLK